MRLTFGDRMAVAAHRGDSYSYYENTMTAFKSAHESGADMIETDIHLTADNELVLIHDATVDRTTNGKGRVDKMTFSELRALNAGDSASYEQIPTLEELLLWAFGTELTLNLEIKEYYSKENEERAAYTVDKTIELVEKYKMGDRIVINSFDAWILEYVYKKYGKKYKLHGFYPYREMSNVKISPDEYLYCACIFENEKREHYEYLVSRGIEPWVGASVTQISKLKICLDNGARLITTNNPGDIIAKLRRLKENG